MNNIEIFERIRESIERKGISLRKVEEEIGIRIATLGHIFRNKSGQIYTVLDLIDEAGLELQLDNKPMKCHQDVIDYVNSLQPINRRVSQSCGAAEETIAKFRRGDNVQFAKALQILDAMGIEVRVV